LLSYDKRYEFPKERLKFGDKLGDGCFGQVFKAKAVSINPNENVTTVAVKTIGSLNKTDSMNALINELKILNYLRTHLNVVNLLGACTKNIIKGFKKKFKFKLIV
jgi:serine/threonine protein kinase